MRAWVAAALLGTLTLGPGWALHAQGGSSSRTFRARLSPVPIDTPMVDKVTGLGSVRATLAGSKLTLQGEFKGLQSPATVARLHRARKGMNGPVLFELEVTPATSGEISGALDLTPAQAEDLAREWLYIQLHSKEAPEGNLRGWLLPEESRR